MFIFIQTCRHVRRTMQFEMFITKKYKRRVVRDLLTAAMYGLS